MVLHRPFELAALIGHLKRIHIPCSHRNAALLDRRRLSKRDLCFTVIRRLFRGLHDRQPSMANLGLNSVGARRCVFWNLAVPSWLYYSRLCLHRPISLAWTAICSLVHCSRTGSVRCHTSFEFMVAAPSPVNRMPSRRSGLRGRGLLVAIVARRMASWSCVRSVRLDCVGSSDD
jgi:hypothetical protein